MRAAAANSLDEASALLARGRPRDRRERESGNNIEAGCVCGKRGPPPPKGNPQRQKRIKGKNCARKGERGTTLSLSLSV